MSWLKDLADCCLSIATTTKTAVDSLVDFATKEVEAANKKVRIEFGIYQTTQIAKIFKQAIDEFYGDYTPLMYDRHESLYQILDIPVDEYGMFDPHEPDFRDMYDESDMTHDRRGKSLFETVFVKGYHGGAMSISANKTDTWGSHPHPGVPYYRTRGLVSYPDGNSAWHRFGAWGEKAAHSHSPFFTISERIAIADDDGGEWDKKYDDILNNIKQEAVAKVEGQSNKLFSKVKTEIDRCKRIIEGAST